MTGLHDKLSLIFASVTSNESRPMNTDPDQQKDIPLQNIESSDDEALQQKITLFVHDLLLHDFSQPCRLIYRHDVSEKKFSRIMQNSDVEQQASNIAALIIEREKAKIITRNAYRKHKEDKGKVTFLAKDYRDRAINKPVTLDGVEFLRRFCLHILPRRFVKIRRYGIYNPTVKRNLKIQFVPEEKQDIEMIINPKQPPKTKRERFELLTGIDLGCCLVCKKERMVVVAELPRIRSPETFLPAGIPHYMV